MNQQKLEWHKTFRADQKREDQLTDELRMFINSNEQLQKDIHKTKTASVYSNLDEPSDVLI